MGESRAGAWDAPPPCPPQTHDKRRGVQVWDEPESRYQPTWCATHTNKEDPTHEGPTPQDREGKHGRRSREGRRRTPKVEIGQLSLPALLSCLVLHLVGPAPVIKIPRRGKSPE